MARPRERIQGRETHLRHSMTLIIHVLVTCVILGMLPSAAYAQAAVTPEPHEVETQPSTQPFVAGGRGGAFGITTGPFTVDGYLPARASTLFSSVWNTSENLTAQADVSLSRFETGHLAGYGEIHTGARLAASSLALVSWQTNAGGGVYRGHGSSEYLTTAIRLERAGTGNAVDNRVWLATGIGAARDATAYATGNVTLGALMRQGDASATGTLSLVHARNTYDDLAGQLDWAPGGIAPLARLHAQLFGGARIGNTAGAYDRWAAISVTARLIGTSALVVAHGTAPSDPERAIQAVAYTSVGLRLTFGGTAVRMPVLAISHVASTRRTAAAVLSAISADGTRTLTIHVTARAHADIMADFTDWIAVPMTRAGGDTWTSRVRVRTGAHHVNVRLDDGAWEAIPGLPFTSDEFGSSTSLLVVP